MFRDSRIILVIAVAIGLCSSLLHLEWFAGHEQYSYIWRTLEWAQELRAGSLYARWCPDFYGGFGSPLFLFYAPVIYSMAGTLTATFLDPFDALKVVVIVGSVLSGVGTYALVYGETRQRDAALLGALAYLASPYRNGNLYARGDIGEFFCIALLPVVIALYRAAAREAQPGRARLLAVAAAATHGLVIMTHAVLGLWGSLVIGLIVLGSVIWLWVNGVWRRAVPLVSALACAPGLAGVYVVPAMAYRSLTHTENLVNGFFRPQDQWISFSSLFGKNTLFSPNFLAIGYLVAAACVAGVLVLIFNFRQGRAVLGWLALTLGLVFLTLPQARWFWEPGRVPLSQFIQFPWRLMGPASLTASVALGIALAHSGLGAQLKGALAIVVPTAFFLLVSWPFLSQIEYKKAGSPRDPDSLRVGLYSATDADEYQPTGTGKLPQRPRGEDLVLRKHGAEVQFTSSDGSRHSLGLKSEQDNADVTLGVYDFPGWKIETLSGPAQAKLGADKHGLITVQLPVTGEYRLAVRYGASPASLLGGWLSVLSVLALGLIGSSRIALLAPAHTQYYQHRSRDVNPVVNDTLGQAQRSIASARALFRDGLVPECQEYMLKALRTLVEAWLPVAPAEADPERPSDTEQALRALEQARYRRPERLRAALAVAEKSAASDAANPADFPSNSEWLWTEIDRLNRFTVEHFKTPAARKRQRIQRGIALGLGLLVTLVFLQRLWGRPHVHASAVYSDEYLARLAIDGLDATEWLLPENTPGWIDLLPPRARTLHGVVLTNAHNGYGMDRASKNVRVTAYSDAGPVGSVEGVFQALTQDRSVLDLPLEAKDVVRVRVEVLSFHKRGAGLAEIELR